MKRGFSIPELLVVMFIIAVLVTIFFVNARISRNKSKIVVAKTDIARISNSVQAQYADTKLWPGQIKDLIPQQPDVRLTLKNGQPNPAAGLASGANACATGTSPTFIKIVFKDSVAPIGGGTYTNKADPDNDKWNGYNDYNKDGKLDLLDMKNTSTTYDTDAVYDPINKQEMRYFDKSSGSYYAGTAQEPGYTGVKGLMPEVFPDVDTPGDNFMPLGFDAAGGHFDKNGDNYYYVGTCFPNWNGPYMSSKDLGLDPWGRPYILDYDYYGAPFLDNVGYDNNATAGKKVQVAILSLGPNGLDNDCDDIYKSLFSRDVQINANTTDERDDYNDRRGKAKLRFPDLDGVRPCENFDGAQ